MQYVLLAWGVLVFAGAVSMLRRFRRRGSLLLPAAVTAAAAPVAQYGGPGAVWMSGASSGRAAGAPGLSFTLFPWGVRFGATSRLAAWAVPTIEMPYAELRGDAVRSKLRSQGVRLRSTNDPQRYVILWTPQWSQVLDALASHGVPVEKDLHPLDWMYQ